MTATPTDALQKIRRFDQLVAYLRDELDWPIETDDFDDLTFDYEPEELGIDPKYAATIDSIKQLRPLTSDQPWGVFWIKFKPRRLPVIALRRILGQLVVKKRAAADRAERPAWQSHDLMLISAVGEDDDRQINFAHFADESDRTLPTLRILGWDGADTVLKLDHLNQELHDNLKWPADETDHEAWRTQWSDAFKLRHREVINTSRKLSVRLAELARNIRLRCNAALALETEKGPLRTLMGAFRQALVHDLDEDDFADMYAQTIAYGLLSARVSRHVPGEDAALLPEDVTALVLPTNPFLKELMQTFFHVGGRKMSSGKGGLIGIDFDELGINDVVEVLKVANMDAVLRDFGDRNPQEDPVIHFYELFLSEYDAEKRMQRGVFYTPRPVVSFIVRSVDELLRSEFDLDDGLADTATWAEMTERFDELEIPAGATPDQAFVQILDPATGTGTFLVEVIDVIHGTMTAKWESEGRMPLEFEKLWNDYVPKHLLPRLHGYELMMAPYAIAHMKIGLKLFETGYTFGSVERARIYLTNALELPHDLSDTFEQMAPALAHEARDVNDVKRHRRFTVVIGNPPYSLISANMGDDQRALVERYKLMNGTRLEERGALQLEKILNDDYVKFLAIAQGILEDSRTGMLGFITNHAYLDNPTMRGLRHSFLSGYRLLMFYDLGGSTKKATGAVVDENVFDIQQGVAIGLLVAGRDGPGREMRGTMHAQLSGSRMAKYEVLAASTVRDTEFDSVNPCKPFYLFKPVDYALQDEYQRFIPLTEVFELKSIGLFTSKDSLVIDPEAEIVETKVRHFQRSSLTDEALCEEVGITAKKAWDVTKSRTRLRSLRDLRSTIVRFLHRPFDYKYLFYDRSLVWSMAWPVNRNLLNGDNLALTASRQLAAPPWNHVFCSNTIVELCYITNKTKEGNHVFPLFVHPDQDDLHSTAPSPRSNISNEFESRLARATSVSGDPEKAFRYIYAVLHSIVYRKRYLEFLRMDFPRVPLPGGRSLFDGLVALGGELVALHLLNSPRLENLIDTYTGPSNPETEKISYADGTVWLDKNRTRGFVGVPEEVWNFRVGAYRLCEKWLKDRQAKGGRNPRPGRILTDEDIAHYQKIVVALGETIRIMGEIDEVIDAHGGWPDAYVTTPDEMEQLNRKASSK